MDDIKKRLNKLMLHLTQVKVKNNNMIITLNGFNRRLI